MDWFGGGGGRPARCPEIRGVGGGLGYGRYVALPPPTPRLPGRGPHCRVRARDDASVVGGLGWRGVGVGGGRWKDGTAPQCHARSRSGQACPLGAGVRLPVGGRNLQWADGPGSGQTALIAFSDFAQAGRKSGVHVATAPWRVDRCGPEKARHRQAQPESFPTTAHEGGRSPDGPAQPAANGQRAGRGRGERTRVREVVSAAGRRARTHPKPLLKLRDSQGDYSLERGLGRAPAAGGIPAPRRSRG